MFGYKLKCSLKSCCNGCEEFHVIMGDSNFERVVRVWCTHEKVCHRYINECTQGGGDEE